MEEKREGQKKGKKPYEKEQILSSLRLS